MANNTFTFKVAKIPTGVKEMDKLNDWAILNLCREYGLNYCEQKEWDFPGDTYGLDGSDTVKGNILSFNIWRSGDKIDKDLYDIQAILTQFEPVVGIKISSDSGEFYLWNRFEDDVDFEEKLLN